MSTSNYTPEKPHAVQQTRELFKRQTNPEKDSRSSPKHRAIRLKSLREMTGLSRDMIMKRYNIARGTLQNWETARFGGLTPKGATNILRAFQAEGIKCQLEWLLHGIGPGPQFSENISSSFSSNFPATQSSHSARLENELSLITQELLFFRQRNADSIDMVIQDDSMSPRYLPGDYVAGIRRYKGTIERLAGLVCIIQTSDYGTLLRQLIPGEEPDHYHLLANTTTSNVSRPVLYNVDVISAAPVIWARRVSPLITLSHTALAEPQL